MWQENNATKPTAEVEAEYNKLHGFSFVKVCARARSHAHMHMCTIPRTEPAQSAPRRTDCAACSQGDQMNHTQMRSAIELAGGYVYMH